jgi:hypothetical protein
MMIKYEIEKGDKISTGKARWYRDSVYKPALLGLRCGKCKGNTVIKFVSTNIVVSDTYTMHGVTEAVYAACCTGFEQRLKAKVDNFSKNLLL